MKPVLGSLAVFAAIALSRGATAAEPLLPATEGTTWRYAVVDQTDGAAPNENRVVTVRIAGTHGWEGKRLLMFETLNGDAIAKTELLEIGEHGVVCYARGVRNELLAKVDPPETFLPADLKVGKAWETEGLVNDIRLHQHFTVAAEEDVYVPAGRFHAFRLHSEGNALMAVAVDRWFVPGVGFVKDVATMRGPGGALLQRTTVELQARPEVVPLPTPAPTPTPTATPQPMPSGTPHPTPSEHKSDESGVESSAPSPEIPAPPDGKRLVVDVSDDPAGGQKTEFHSDVTNIYVRWHGRGLPEKARVRIAWVAEDVGDIVEPNFVVDQTETVAPAPDSSARFTLGRPEDGWAEGKYRVEFYINDALEETIHVRIVK
ncbi:MAG: hypothetical protein ACJ8KU_04215 [Chthoniobacterales bacterium]